MLGEPARAWCNIFNLNIWSYAKWQPDRQTVRHPDYVGLTPINQQSLNQTVRAGGESGSKTKLKREMYKRNVNGNVALVSASVLTPADHYPLLITNPC